MDEFTQERNLERRTLAIINYFKIYKLGTLTSNEKDIVFEMLGGKSLVTKLANAASEGLFNASQTNEELLNELNNNINIVNGINWTQSIITDEINRYGTEIIKESQEIDKNETAIRTFLTSLPVEFVSNNSELISLVINEKSNDKEKIKTIKQPQ